MINGLTEKENEFIQAHKEIAAENCGAETWTDLAEDNHSCATVGDFEEKTEFSRRQIAGLIRSLVDKGVIVIEERECDATLYWINDYFVEEMAKQEAKA
jgi:predicted hydrocarbon binding protein